MQGTLEVYALNGSDITGVVGGYIFVIHQITIVQSPVATHCPYYMQRQQRDKTLVFMSTAVMLECLTKNRSTLLCTAEHGARGT